MIENIKLFLKTNKISALSVANHLNISRSHLCRVLKGERKMTDILRIKLNNYLNTNF